MTDSLDDPFVFDLIDRFGGDGYLVYFGMLEIIAKEYNILTKDSCTFSVRFLRKKLHVSAIKLEKILHFCHKSQKIYVKYGAPKKTEITFNCPRLKEIADEWSKKKLRSGSGETPT